MNQISILFNKAFTIIVNGIETDANKSKFINDGYLIFWYKLYHFHYYYSLYLSKVECLKAEKYSRQCFNWRPSDQYLHYQFSLYLLT